MTVLVRIRKARKRSCRKFRAGPKEILRGRDSGLPCFAWSRSAAQKPFSAEVFVKFGPVDAVTAASDFPVHSCLGVAFSSVGYHISGTVIVRPSFSATLRLESVNETSAALSSAPSAKIPMPSLQELLLMLHYDVIQHA